MHTPLLRSLRPLALSAILLALTQTAGSWPAPQDGGDFSQSPQARPLPTDALMVKGAWASASDSVTPLPEGGSLADNAYTNQYFALIYVLPPGWTQKYYGPPPSDSGYYVLAQITPAATNKVTGRGTILIAAQDLFFTLVPAANAFEFINYAEGKLQADYKVERALTPVSLMVAAFFSAIGCALCHTPSLTTQPSKLTSGLGNAIANLFSDIEIHHMGARLADNVSQGGAGGDQFRTAPLWGLGQRIFFLHDGRCSDLLCAIEAHESNGGEATTVEAVFDQLLTPSQQQDILNFLRSL